MAETVLKGVEKFFTTLDQKLEKSVKVHLQSVYTTLAIGLLGAAAGAYVHVFTNIVKGNVLMSLLALVPLLLLYSTSHDGRNDKLRLGYFLAFTSLSGLATGPLLDFAIAANPNIIVTAFLGTCIIFGCFSLAALYAPDRKFLYLGGVLMSVLSAMFWLGLANLFLGSRMIFQANLYVGLAVMCGFVLYDTQLIVEKRRAGDNDYVWHAVDLFIDFLDVFRRLVIILTQKEEGKKRRKD